MEMKFTKHEINHFKGNNEQHLAPSQRGVTTKSIELQTILITPKGNPPPIKKSLFWAQWVALSFTLKFK